MPDLVLWLAFESAVLSGSVAWVGLMRKAALVVGCLALVVLVVVVAAADVVVRAAVVLVVGAQLEDVAAVELAVELIRC